MTANRIDTHAHMVPDRYRAWLEQRGVTAGGKAIPAWSPEVTLDFMDRNEIAASILSISTPGVYLGDWEEARAMARGMNEEAASLVQRWPDRFGFFASLTLPDVEGAIAEAEYALNELNADGIVLMTNVDGVYLGDPGFDPLMEALDKNRAVIFCHPGHLPGPAAPGIEPFVADFLLDTVRAAVRLAQANVHERFPNLSLILSHGGGFVPYAAMRIARACAPGSTAELGLERLRKFYLDTALASSQFSLPSLLAFADPQRITFGSDLPYADDARATAFTRMLDHYPLEAKQRNAIARGNASRLFPRLSQ